MDDSPNSSAAPLITSALAALLVGTLWLNWGFADEPAPAPKRKRSKPRTRIEPEPKRSEPEVRPEKKPTRTRKPKYTLETEGKWRTDWYATGGKHVHSSEQKTTIGHAATAAKDLVIEARHEWGPDNGPKPMRWTLTNARTGKVVASGNGKTERLKHG